MLASKKKFEIPSSLILNLDQTPLKYALVGNMTMAEKGSKSVVIDGVEDKLMFTGTFAITLSGKFLPIQLIYGGKTKQSIPKGFSLSIGPKHLYNARE